MTKDDISNGVNSLEELKKRLYKPKEPFEERKREEPAAKQSREKVPAEWDRIVFEGPEDIAAKTEEIEVRFAKRKKMKRILTFGAIILILLAAVFILGYRFYIRGGGLGFLSSQNIEIKIDGPENLKAGEKIKWRANIKNNNKISLEDAVLIIEYPEGAEPVNKLNTDSLTERRIIGSVEAGAEKEDFIEAFIFGEENSEQKIKISLEYRLKDSSAIFEKSEEKNFLISEPALTVFIEAPKEINLGKEINFKIDIIADASAILKNIVLDLEYPEGFEFTEAHPSSSGNKTRWELGDLLAGEKKIVEIKGKISPKALIEEEIITASAGVIDEEGNLKTYGKKTASLAIKKPFLDVVFKINNKDEYTAQAGEKLDVVLKWANNLPLGVKNVVIEATIDGRAADLSSLSINKGSYKSFNNAIIWDSSTFPKFSYLEAGEEGEIGFSVKIKDPLPIKTEGDKNFTINFEAKFFTAVIPEEYGDREIGGNDKKTVKIVSNLQFIQRGLFYSGPFKNSGPIPPKVGKETTYSIVWSLANSSNDLSDIRVSGFLPKYVKWQNQIYPQTKSGRMSYNSESGEVVWLPEKIQAGTGAIRPAEEIAFQILFLPAEAHLGSSQILISKAAIEAKDDFAAVILKSSQPAVTTELRDDPQMGYGKGKVIR